MGFSTTPGSIEETDHGRLRQRPTTGNGNVATKTGKLISLELWQIEWQFQRLISGFRPRPARRHWPRTIATTTDNQKWQNGHQNRKYLYNWNYGREDDSSNANYGFSTTPSSQKLTVGDGNDDRQPEIAIWTFCSSISQFLAVVRCRNHLNNPLSSSTSSKISNLAWEFRRHLSQFQRRNYFRLGGHIDISGCRSLLHLYLPTLFYTCTWFYTPVSLEF